MNQSIFQAIRERVTAKEAAQAYGLAIARNGRALCPWHDDTHPDLAFYGDHCYCHACHSGGDAVALAAKLLGVSMIEAARAINEDFRLGLDERGTSRPAGPTPAQIRQKERENERRAWGVLCDAVREADATLSRFPDGSAWDDPAFRKALAARCHADYQLDMMQEEAKARGCA